MSLWRPRAAAALVASFALLHGASGVAGPAQTVKVPLSWERGSVHQVWPQDVRLHPEPPGGVIPPAALHESWFARVPIGAERTTVVALDWAPGFERMWVDSDFDGDLTDEAPVAWQASGLRCEAAGQVNVTIAGSRETVPVQVLVHRGAFSARDRVRVRVGTHRWGAAALDGRLLLAALEDGNGDMRFDSPVYDRVYVDLNGDGEFDARPGSTETVSGDDPFRLGETVWKALTPPPDGRHVVFSRVWGAPPKRNKFKDAGPRRPAVFSATATGDFDQLARRYQSELDWGDEARLPTIRELGHASGIACAELLLRIAKEDRAASARIAAVRAMGKPPWVEFAGDGVIALTRGRDALVAAEAVDALAGMRHPKAADELTSLLASPHARVVERAATQLARMDTSSARSAVLKTLRDSLSPSTRLAAYRGLRRGPDGPSATAMILAGEDTFGPLQAQGLADLFLVRNGKTKTLALAAAAAPNRHPEVTAALPPILAHYRDDDCIRALVALGRVPRERESVRRMLSRVLQGSAALKLTVALTSEHQSDRILAAQVLGLSGHPHVARRIAAQLEVEPKRAAREALLLALGELGSEEAIEVLGRMAVDTERNLRSWAMGALADPQVRHSPKARSFVIRQLRDDLWRNRVQAVVAVRRWGDTSLTPKLLAALRDDHRSVRKAAAEALGDLRTRGSVRPLIDRLETEPSTSVRAAIGTSLFRLTGMNLYDEADLWNQWWEEQGEGFSVPAVAPVLPPDAVGGTRAPPRPRFYGIEIEAESVIFVIDHSGSMDSSGAMFGPRRGIGKSKWDVACGELLGAVEAMDDRARVNVILFESVVTSWRRKLALLSKSTRQSLKSHLESQRPLGATNLYDALERALLTKGVETVVLLSDGQPNQGRLTDMAPILKEVRRINAKRGVVIHTVSIGGDSALLQRLASQNSGKYAKR